MVEEQVEEGVFLGTPHYSIIEIAAMNLGHELSREAQQRAAREVAANFESQAACPRCKTKCKVRVKKREVLSLAVRSNWPKPWPTARPVVGLFFPQRVAILFRLTVAQ